MLFAITIVNNLNIGIKLKGKIVKEVVSSTYIVKQSKFISFLVPYSEFDYYFSMLKSEHPKARHHVYAYRYINEYDQVVENQTDDGEPKGSAGKPTLSVVRGQAILNSAVITVRYFGGIKLGIGGMVRAYSESANLVITKADNENLLEEYFKTTMHTLEVTYSNMAKVLHIIGCFNISNIEKEFMNDGVKLSFELKEELLDEVVRSLKDFSV